VHVPDTLARTPPGAQHAAAPEAELVPKGHGKQTLGEVAKPLVVSEYFPALQGVQEEVLPELQDPAGHRVSHENTPSRISNPAYPATLLKDPGGHTRQEASVGLPVLGW